MKRVDAVVVGRVVDFNLPNTHLTLIKHLAQDNVRALILDLALHQSEPAIWTFNTFAKRCWSTEIAAGT